MLQVLKHHDRPKTYRSFESGMEYAEFRGGFSWPIEGRHNYLCVIGLEAASKKLRLGAEYQENSFEELAARLKVMTDFYHIPHWFAPVTGDYESYYDTLRKICDKIGFSLICVHPTMADDLQLSVHLVNAEINRNSLMMPDPGILIRNLDKLNTIDLDDHSKIAKMQPIIVASQLIFEFPNIEARIERARPKDAYAMDDDDDPYAAKTGTWLSAL